MASPLHAELVALGARWLRAQGFAVVATELAVAGAREREDVVAFRTSCSVVLEAKASRADFHADRKKPQRATGGMGTYRYFICPAGLIDTGDLPPRWGLLWAMAGGKVVVRHGPAGNLWSAFESASGSWLEFAHHSELRIERAVLFSIARRQAAALAKAQSNESTAASASACPASGS